MKSLIQVFSALLIGVMALCAQTASDITGTWTAAIDSEIVTLNYTFTFKVEGEKLSGKAKSIFGDLDITEGTLKGNVVTFVEPARDVNNKPFRILYVGKIAGDEIRFFRRIGTVGVDEFVARRSK